MSRLHSRRIRSCRTVSDLENRMTDVLPPSLEPWANFYVIVGSSAGALTGLQFVVISLVAERRRMTSLADVATFGTPMLVHFGYVLLLSAILSAPWATLTSAALAIGISGFLALGYTANIARRARSTQYRPVFEDVLFHMILPAIGYAMIVIAAVVMPR